MPSDRISPHTLNGALQVMDVDSYDRLGLLASALNFQWHGKPCITRLMRAVSRIDPLVLEEVLADCEDTEDGEEAEGDE